jgi:hypothetical protein
MPLTIAQTIAFWENEMKIPEATRLQLAHEGITEISDLGEIDKENLKQIAENLRRPAGRVPDPNAAVGAANPTMPTPPFVFGAISQLRMNVAIDCIKYYETIGRPLTPGNIRWDPTIKTFAQHWKSLKDRKEESAPATPKITKTLDVMKWTESFADFLNRVIGMRTIPLSYVTRQDGDVPNAAPALATNQPYGEVFGSVEAELIARASHGHAMFRDDNAKVYYYLEEATRTTVHAASIKPFQRAKDGRGAWKAIISQYAGEDKWRMELKSHETLLHTRKWKGQQNFSLERFVAQHRNAFITMTQCAEYVSFQLPNEQTRVTYLMDAIECNDAPLQAAMALVRNDNGTTGKMNDFEATASFLLPHCPVAKKRTSGSKREIANISDLHVHDDQKPARPTHTRGGRSPKKGIGKSGVHFRFHNTDEYRKLSPDQKDELREHRNELQSNGKGRKLAKGGSNKKPSTNVSATLAQIDKRIEEKLKTTEADATSAEQLQTFLIALVNGTKAASNANASSTVALPPPPATATPPIPPLAALQSILKRAKN